MSDIDLCYTPASELSHKFRVKELSPVDVVKNSLARIEEVNPKLNCFCFTYPEEAIKKAKVAEQAFANGTARPLEGIPIAIKDFTPTKGYMTTRGSKLLKDWIPDRTAIVVERLENSGAIMIGKTTTPEFAFSSFTDSPLWGTTRNPWNTERTSGGSSGGSGAAVASGCVALAEGTDMGGSVRIPAAFCGIVGHKPSLGRIPMDIVDTCFDNISHFGPLSRTVSDALMFLDATQGEHPSDIQSLPPCDLTKSVSSNVEGLSIAYSIDHGFCAVDDGVVANLLKVVDALREGGATITEIELDWDQGIQDLWMETWSVFMAAAYTKLTDRPLEENRHLLSEGFARLVEAGQQVSAVKLRLGEFERTKYWHKLATVLENHHALLSPTMAKVAPVTNLRDWDFGTHHNNDKVNCLDMTAQFNYTAQCPALSVPSGFSDELPTAVQIVSRKWDDALALRIGAAVESNLPWADRRPPI